MRRREWILLISLFLIPCMAGVVFLDLAGMFQYSDLPFLLALLIYIPFILIQRSGSRCTFAILLLLLIYMGFSYIPTGAGPMTERFAEWFYLFFAFGLIQYAKEAWQKKK